MIEPIGQLGEVLQLVIWLLIAIVVGIMTIAGASRSGPSRRPVNRV